MNKKQIAIHLQVTIAPLIETDIEKFDQILIQHVRSGDTGQILEDEIKSIKNYMRGAKDDCGRVRKYLVAKLLDGRIVGCMAYSSPDQDMIKHFSDIDPSKAVELLNAFVDSSVFRGRGVGRQLFNQVCLSAKAEDKKFLVVNSGPRYKLSWPFYDKVCDENRGLIIGKYGQGGDANTWLKKLLDKKYDGKKFFGAIPDFPNITKDRVNRKKKKNLIK